MWEGAGLLCTSSLSSYVWEIDEGDRPEPGPRDELFGFDVQRPRVVLYRGKGLSGWEDDRTHASAPSDLLLRLGAECDPGLGSAQTMHLLIHGRTSLFQDLLFLT